MRNVGLWVVALAATMMLAEVADAGIFGRRSGCANGSCGTTYVRSGCANGQCKTSYPAMSWAPAKQAPVQAGPKQAPVQAGPKQAQYEAAPVYRPTYQPATYRTTRGRFRLFR